MEKNRSWDDKKKLGEHQQLRVLLPDKQSNANPVCWNHPTELSEAGKTQRWKGRGRWRWRREPARSRCFPALGNEVLWFTSHASSFSSSHPMDWGLPMLPCLPHVSSPDLRSPPSPPSLILPCASACLSPVRCWVSFQSSPPAEILSGFCSCCRPRAFLSFLSLCVAVASGSTFPTTTVTL